jgi:translation initiation factor 4E
MRTDLSKYTEKDVNHTNQQLMAGVAQGQRLLSKAKLVQNFHDLQNVWTFYYLVPNREGQKDKNWKDFLHKLYDFRSFEDFWAIVNTIEPASKLPKGCRYYIFKQGVQPLWEDEKNLHGSELYTEYALQVQKSPLGKQKSVHALKDEPGNIEAEKHWKDLALSVLANALTVPHGSKINGVEFNCKRNSVKVGVWTGPITDEEFRDLSQAVKAILKCEGEIKSSKIEPEDEKPDSKP